VALVEEVAIAEQSRRMLRHGVLPFLIGVPSDV
jgi:hypothetical protein